MSADRPIQDTESTLEFILNTLCRAFEMKPKQAAALLTNNNQFLIHSVVKGVKGKYDPVMTWYTDLYGNSKHMTTLLELEVEQLNNLANYTKVLYTISTGMYSNNLDVCKWCLKLMTKVAFDFSSNDLLSQHMMNWFLEKDGGLELALIGFKRHPEIAEEFIVYMSQFSTSDEKVQQIYKVSLKKFFNSPLEYLTAINDLLPFLLAHQSEEILSAGIVEFWMQTCLKQADNDGKHSADERITALTLITELWLAYTEDIDKNEEVIKQA